MPKKDKSKDKKVDNLEEYERFNLTIDFWNKHSNKFIDTFNRAIEVKKSESIFEKLGETLYLDKYTYAVTKIERV